MACFSDLWRCTESDGPYTDPASVTPRRGLCALPPRREESRAPPCPAVPDPVLGPAVSWPRAEPRTAARLACPGGQRGQARWDCGDWGLRVSLSPDYSDCAALGDIKDLLQTLREDQARPVEVLEEVNEDIRTSEESLGGGDILSVVELLHTAVSRQQEQQDRLEDNTSFLAASLETVNNLGKTQKIVWPPHSITDWSLVQLLHY